MTSILIPLFFKKTSGTKTGDNAAKYLYFIMVYAFMSTLWADYYISYWYIFYQLALAILTLSIPYLMAKITNNKFINYPKLITNFSLILSMCFLVFIIRQEEGIRLNSYLGGAALIGIAMIPVIAVHFHNLLQRERIISSTFGFLVTLLAIFLTESRIALFMVILFVVVTVIRKPTFKRWIVVGVLTLLFLLAFSDDISIDRYDEMFVDEARSTMLETAIKGGTHSVPAFFFGNGYGSIWKWHAFEIGQLPYWQYPFQPTEHGYVMFHAHSVFNQLFAELGLAGTIPFLAFVLILIKETFISWRRKNELRTNILISILCTLPALMTELLFFRNWEVTIVWLFYTFSALNYSPSKTTGINNVELNSKKTYERHNRTILLVK